MSEKKLKIMSLSVEAETQELLKNSAKRIGISVSQLIRDLVEKYLDLIVNSGEEIPVILQVPIALKGNPEEVKKWLEARIDTVVKALS